ncbi:MAG: helix-turn-helix transcriptional regulator [Pseudomonadota bacterium]
MSDFASSALFNLASAQLSAMGYRAAPSSGFAGKVAANSKTSLVEGALQALGASAIVSIGQGVKAVPQEPTLAVLRRATDPADFIDRWMRLERYYHGKHRVLIKSSGSNETVLQHYSVEGDPPTIAEDLLIAGLLAALLEEVGCQELSLQINGIAGEAIRAGQLVHNASVPDKPCDVWSYKWTAFNATQPEPKSAAPDESFGERAALLMADDPAAIWQVDKLAGALGLSTRSLQRALAAEGDTFQKLLRRVRTDKASQALLAQSQGLAEIGYTCGFSDQAHFNRDFKARFNMTPGAYRDLAAGS